MTSQQLFEQFISSRSSHPDYSESFTKCKDKEGNELEEYACHRIQQDYILWQKAVSSIEIELPEREYSCEHGFHYYDAGNMITALESAEVKIK